MTRTKQERLIEIVQRHPGLDAIALMGKGFHPRKQGSLREAERAGLLRYTNGGWYVVEVEHEFIQELQIQD